MSQHKEFSVIDINAGFGGRSLALECAGFRVLAAFEREETNRDVCRSLLPEQEIIGAPLSPENLSLVPDADVLTGDLTSADSMKTVDYEQNNLLLSELILRKRPKAFLLQLPTVMLRNRDFELLNLPVHRRYDIFYQAFQESEYSGFPVLGSQVYLVGIHRELAGDRFPFPYGKYTELRISPIQEKADDVSPWYRKLPPKVADAPIYPAEYACPYYLKRRKGRLIGSERIALGHPSDCYLRDDRGLRRITHFELACLKGYMNYPFNECRNRHKMYRWISNAPDLHVVAPIAVQLKDYLDSLDGRHEKMPTDATAPFPKTPKKEKTGDSVGRNAIVIPRNRIVKLHIDKLKGLKNLDISIGRNLTAIMGVNGVGKSTILHALACMFSPVQTGEDYRFRFFFTPTPDSSWQDSRMTLTCYDENMQTEVNRVYQKNSKRWSPRYAHRPKRDLFYLGIDSGLPEIEKERQTTYIDYLTDVAEDRLSQRIIEAASEILDKDYEKLTYHNTKKTKLLGVRTASRITYSSLSMGAGEQRLFKILTEIYKSRPYTLFLIDEIDLLLHSSAQKRLIRKLHEIAVHKNLQIIFTTHSLEIAGLTDYVDVRYLYHTKEKTMVYDAITQDILFDISREPTQPLTIYVEDDLAAMIITQVARSLNMLRHVKIQNIGSVENAFTLAAGLVLEGTSSDNRLIVLDGDAYRSDEEKRKQLRKRLTGTELAHAEKLSAAFSIITQFSMPEGISPEKMIYDMLMDLKGSDEVTDCARSIRSVSDPHDWIDRIVQRMNQERSITLYQIIEQVSEHERWDDYVGTVRAWLMEKRDVLDEMKH